MPRESAGVNDPGRWMEFAKDDLKIAKTGKLLDFRREALCFHAQQAAEKALKAILISCQVRFPKSHRLEELFDLLPPDLSPPPVVRKASILSDYAESGRYPSDMEDVTEKDYQEAVQHAEAVVKWAEKIIQSKEDSQGHFLHEPPAEYAAHHKIFKKAQVVSRHRGSNHRTKKARSKKRGRK